MFLIFNSSTSLHSSRYHLSYLCMPLILLEVELLKIGDSDLPMDRWDVPGYSPLPPWFHPPLFLKKRKLLRTVAI